MDYRSLALAAILVTLVGCCWYLWHSRAANLPEVAAKATVGFPPLSAFRSWSDRHLYQPLILAGSGPSAYVSFRRKAGNVRKPCCGV